MPLPALLRTGASTASASATGTMVIARQRVGLGRAYAGRTVTVAVTDANITVECDGDSRTFQRTTDLPIRNHKANRPGVVEDTRAWRQ